MRNRVFGKQEILAVVSRKLCLGKCHMDIKVAYFSDRGVIRKVNEDALVIRTAETKDGMLGIFAVCDGMGGRYRGELASSFTVRRLSEWFEEQLPVILRDGYDFLKLSDGIKFVLRNISSVVEKNARQKSVKMGSTCALLFLYGKYCVTANVGDSRVYFVDKEIQQLTKDHSAVQREIDSGVLSPDQAEKARGRNIILQCLGETATLSPDVVEQKVPENAMYLICSDGFRHRLAPQEILHVLSQTKGQGEEKMQEALSALAKTAMDRGETDNITAIAAQIC